MDEMTSSEFRRRYATLKTPTSVTVLGRPIGVWIPAIDGTKIEFATNLTGGDRGDTFSDYRPAQRTVTITPGDPHERFNSQPFTGPIPKVRK